jgi:hypothetical protein
VYNILTSIEYNKTPFATNKTKMPKLQRTAQFREAITCFMSSVFIETGMLQTWSMTLLTENTKKNKHDYLLTLPYAYPAYMLEKEVIRSDGTVQKPGEVYLPQLRPSINEFCNAFCDYFERFRYISYGKVLSSVELGEIIQDNDVDDISIHFQIIYYKGYQPYPIKLTREQELEVDLQRMRDYCLSAGIANNNLTQTLYQYSAEMDRTVYAYSEKCRKFEQALQKHAISAYKMSDATKCPVCLDEIIPDQLYMPVCLHHICKTCMNRCDRCPLCRGDYFILR